MKHYDALMIGFGKGAKTLAGALAAAGQTVAVAEESENMYGGTCINVGCIPSKSLVTSAKKSLQAGGEFAEKAARYAEAVQEKRRVTSMLRKKNYDKLNGHPNITVLTGKAAFTGPRTVEVATEHGTELLEAGRVFINTGARPFMPPIDGLADSRRVYTSETLMELDALPAHLVIIGGGYIGMEFASMYSNFGSRVTVIQDGPVFLPREDREISQAVLDVLAKRGVTVLFSAKTRSVRDADGCAALTVETAEGVRELTADAILVAAGRRPNLNGLNPEAAGVRTTRRGAVETDEYLRTSAENVWAMGDVAGGLQFTYISLDDYRIVKSQILGDGERTAKNRGAVPYSVFLDPPFSRVGMTEQEALEMGLDVKVAKLPAAAIPKAQVLRETEGLLKAVVDAATGRILGAHLFCAESHEIINVLKLAMDGGIPYTVLRDAIYTHPTMCEALNDLFASI